MEKAHGGGTGFLSSRFLETRQRETKEVGRADKWMVVSLR